VGGWALVEVTGSGYKPEGEFRVGGQKVNIKSMPAALTALWVGALNNDSQLERLDGENGSGGFRIIGDPTEGSILVAAAKAGILPNDLSGTYPRAQEIPFDSNRKRMVTIHQIEDVIPEDSSPIYDEENMIGTPWRSRARRTSF
jgi:Ca2+-transporting ATPase